MCFEQEAAKASEAMTKSVINKGRKRKGTEGERRRPIIIVRWGCRWRGQAQMPGRSLFLVGQRPDAEVPVSSRPSRYPVVFHTLEIQPSDLRDSVRLLEVVRSSTTTQREKVKESMTHNKLTLSTPHPSPHAFAPLWAFVGWSFGSLGGPSRAQLRQTGRPTIGRGACRCAVQASLRCGRCVVPTFAQERRGK
jgi:hypothetical protein